MDILSGILEKHGLGVALAVAIALVCWRLLKHILNSHNEDRKEWKNTLDNQNELIGNHLTHLTEATSKLTVKSSEHDINMKHGLKEIVKAIEIQTNTMQTLYNKGE